MASSFRRRALRPCRQRHLGHHRRSPGRCPHRRAPGRLVPGWASAGKSRMTILAVSAGTSYHLESLEAPRYRRFFDRVLRPEALAEVDPASYDALLIPCRTPGHRMAPHADRIRAYLDQGGTVIAMGETSAERWLPAIRFTPVETNWWWWLDPAGD